MRGDGDVAEGGAAWASRNFNARIGEMETKVGKKEVRQGQSGRGVDVRGRTLKGCTW